MAQKRKAVTKSSGTVLLVGVVPALMMLYVLSTGPAMRLVAQGRLSPKSFNTVYCPILWACAHAPPLHTALGWYTDLWAEDLR